MRSARSRERTATPKRRSVRRARSCDCVSGFSKPSPMDADGGSAGWRGGRGNGLAAAGLPPASSGRARVFGSDVMRLIFPSILSLTGAFRGRSGRHSDTAGIAGLLLACAE